MWAFKRFYIVSVSNNCVKTGLVVVAICDDPDWDSTETSLNREDRVVFLENNEYREKRLHMKITKSH